MSRRASFIDRGLGETRGGVLLDDRPERFFVVRDDAPQRLRLGARLRARVRHVEPQLGIAFLDLGEGAEAILPFKPDARPRQGEALEVEIRAEARAGKLATLRALGPAQGEPALLTPAPDLAEVLAGYVGDEDPIMGAEARALADEAETEVLETVHTLPGGGTIAIETTRALTSVDVDVGDRKGGEVKRVTRQANLAAITEGARLLRLKGQGGLVVFDLAGRGHDGTALMNAMRAAFQPDNPGVAIGPVSRFGTIELTVPRRAAPVRDTLCDAAGRLTDRSLAHRLVRRMESEAAANPGARLRIRCAPPVAEAAAPLFEELAGKIGRRFEVTPEPARARASFEVSAS